MAAEDILILNKHWNDINPVSCGQEFCKPGHSFGPATRNHYLIHYIVSGGGTFSSHGLTHHLQAGDIFFIRPYELAYYEADRHTPWHYIWVGFQTGLSEVSILEQNVYHLPDAGSLFHSMLEAKKLAQGRESYLCCKIWELLSLFQQKLGSSAPSPSDYVLQAINFMQCNYMDSIQIAQLAARLNLDRCYFSTLFRNQTGKSPKQYLTDLRLTRAATLMREHGYPPGEAAVATGYPDICCFSKAFKQKYGVCPNAYRKNTKFVSPTDASK